ncbi:hypothetical protein [Thiolapillus sp.]|uniref:hypothetical protein n=4 Tax=Thiolapillus sp. TaxID=2017437 RepID=UPI003AF61F65
MFMVFSRTFDRNAGSPSWRTATPICRGEETISSKSTRPLTTYLCPSRPGYQALRNNFASSLLLRTWLPYDWTQRSDAYFVFPLAQGTPGKQCGLAATGVYQPSLRSPWLAAVVSYSFFLKLVERPLFPGNCSLLLDRYV